LGAKDGIERVETTTNEPRRRGLFRPRNPHSLYSDANIITLVRLTASLVFFVLAAVKNRELYNYIGAVVHYLGDFSDGFYSRVFKQETILGAEIDIIADRVEALFFFINFLHFHPGLAVPILVYLVDFAFLDFYLSYQFIKYDIISINYFYRVDRRVYGLNFSPAGKLINSTIIPLILIFAPEFWVAALALAAGLIGLKLYSISRLWKLRQSAPLAAHAGDAPSDPESQN
jgi:CDP-diacylglycerol--glycerol-3-phosphate 3-phosphatidyltransferase